MPFLANPAVPSGFQLPGQAENITAIRVVCAVGGCLAWFAGDRGVPRGEREKSGMSITFLADTPKFRCPAPKKASLQDPGKQGVGRGLARRQSGSAHQGKLVWG